MTTRVSSAYRSPESAAFAQWTVPTERAVAGATYDAPSTGPRPVEVPWPSSPKLPFASWPGSGGRGPGDDLLPRRRRAPTQSAAATTSRSSSGVLRSARARANGTESVSSDLEPHRGLREGGIDRTTTAWPGDLLLLGPRLLEGRAAAGAGAQPRGRSTRRPRSASSSRWLRSSSASACCSSTSSGPACSCSSSASWSTTASCSTSSPRDYDVRGHIDHGRRSPATSMRWPRPRAARRPRLAFHVFQQRAVRAPHHRRARAAGPAPSSGRCTRTCGSGCAAASTSGVGANLADIREAVLDVEREVERRREAAAVSGCAPRPPPGAGPSPGWPRRCRRWSSTGSSSCSCPTASRAGWRCDGCGHLGSWRTGLPGCGERDEAGRGHRRGGGRGRPGPVLPRGGLRRQRRPRRHGAHRRPPAVLTLRPADCTRPARRTAGRRARPRRHQDARAS